MEDDVDERAAHSQRDQHAEGEGRSPAAQREADVPGRLAPRGGEPRRPPRGAKRWGDGNGRIRFRRRRRGPSACRRRPFERQALAPDPTQHEGPAAAAAETSRAAGWPAAAGSSAGRPTPSRAASRGWPAPLPPRTRRRRASSPAPGCRRRRGPATHGHHPDQHQDCRERERSGDAAGADRRAEQQRAEPGGGGQRQDEQRVAEWRTAAAAPPLQRGSARAPSSGTSRNPSPVARASKLARTSAPR